MRGIFGRRPPSGDGQAEPPASGNGGPVRATGGFAWSDDANMIACNFALGDLVNNLPARLTVNGRTHAETLVTAAGAIAGFAAQRALFDRLAAQGTAAGLQVATTRGGGRYFFGDALNHALLAQSEDEGYRKLWPLAAGAAVQAGLHATALPSTDDMFRHVAASLGGQDEGFPSVAAEHRPHLPAKPLLKLVWPLALMCFDGKLSGNAVKPPAVVAMHWRPVIAAVAVNRFIGKVASVLAPKDSLVIAMETAIYASKIDPQDIVQAPPCS